MKIKRELNYNLLKYEVFVANFSKVNFHKWFYKFFLVTKWFYNCSKK